MITSQLSAKSQTTIPRAVRQTLGLKPGDAIGYEVNGSSVVMRRAVRPDGFVNNISTFWEWDTEEDRVGFANL